MAIPSLPWQRRWTYFLVVGANVTPQLRLSGVTLPTKRRVGSGLLLAFSVVLLESLVQQPLFEQRALESLLKNPEHRKRYAEAGPEARYARCGNTRNRIVSVLQASASGSGK